jgi:transposase
MNFLNRNQRILAYSAPIDMRKSFIGLVWMVRNDLKTDPLSGDVYLFVNRKGSYLKALLWDRTGYVIISKRLERGRFVLPTASSKEQTAEVSKELLLLLFDGIRV